MVAVVVAPVVAEDGFPAMLLNPAYEHRAVFAADFCIHVDDGMDARHSARCALQQGDRFFITLVGHGFAHPGELIVDAVGEGEAFYGLLDVFAM